MPEEKRGERDGFRDTVASFPSRFLLFVIVRRKMRDFFRFFFFFLFSVSALFLFCFVFVEEKMYGECEKITPRRVKIA